LGIDCHSNSIRMHVKQILILSGLIQNPNRFNYSGSKVMTLLHKIYYYYYRHYNVIASFFIFHTSIRFFFSSYNHNREAMFYYGDPNHFLSTDPNFIFFCGYICCFLYVMKEFVSAFLFSTVFDERLHVEVIDYETLRNQFHYKKNFLKYHLWSEKIFKVTKTFVPFSSWVLALFWGLNTFLFFSFADTLPEEALRIFWALNNAYAFYNVNAFLTGTSCCWFIICLYLYSIFKDSREAFFKWKKNVFR